MSTKKSTAASADRLGNLHSLFTKYWEDMLERTVQVEQADGTFVEKKVPLSASEAAVLRAFLKDNNVQADIDGAKSVQEMADKLKEATAGSVPASEMDAILADFLKMTAGGNA
jgi:hypothetical protein